MRNLVAHNHGCPKVVALTLLLFGKGYMIEKQSVNGKDVWIKVDPYHVERENPNIIPTEYFTASYFMDEPSGEGVGEMIREEGETKLFESPVAALSYARKSLERKLQQNGR